jgi:hypothetical protein
MNTDRGFTQLITLAISILFCAVIGYALMRGFSQQANEAQGAMIVVEGGAPIDSLAPQVSEDPAGEEPLRPMLPDSTSIAPMLSDDDLREGHVELSFAKLSNYQYIYPDPDDPNPLGEQIPDSVRKLNKTKIAIQGFMLPVTLKEQRVTEFLLLKDQSACCWGVWPGLNEWIHVILPEGESVEHIADMPITVFGELLVGEYYEKEVLLGIYRLNFEKLIGPR